MPTSLPCQPNRFDLPAPHQANHLRGQHPAREQERAETARQGSLTVTFTARKSPVQATFHARQPAPAARRYLFQSSFHLRPTACVSCVAGVEDSFAGKTRRKYEPSLGRGGSNVSWTRLLGGPVEKATANHIIIPEAATTPLVIACKIPCATPAQSPTT